ncbi:hypothetical protein [Georgenia thermotolerans]|uniref:hypothetical protein n=1 Tax=Georgenia thermotolerans TaxID=527326 RepID=UPI0012659D47|nr:hypothetical protein [Georgenia thermotolerans]
MVLYRHPYQLSIGVALAVMGTRNLLTPAALPSAIEALPVVVAYGYTVALTLGGIGMFLGPVINGRTTWGLFIEQIGLWFTAFAMGVYAAGLVVVIGSPRVAISVVLLCSLAFACVVRSRASVLDSGYTLHGVRTELARRRRNGEDC